MLVCGPVERHEAIGGPVYICDIYCFVCNYNITFSTSDYSQIKYALFARQLLHEDCRFMFPFTFGWAVKVPF